MTTPDDKSKKSPADRFKKILSAGQRQQQRENVTETRKSPISNLPKARAVIEKPVEETARTLPPKPPADPRLKRESLLPTFWTAASVVSVTVNLILLIMLVSVLRVLGSVNALGMGSGLLGGLYSNFERMDQAHIRTTIPVQTNVPLNLSIPVQTTTTITLAQDVVLRGAHVKISTPTFNIDSPADVTLPAGTPLNVVLNFSVPVQTEVPITMNVPVDIAVQNTELHAAITGLQTTIRPLYCMLAPTALTLNGTPVCR